MYRKAFNIFSLAAGSLTFAYGIKYQYMKETQCDPQCAENVSMKESEKTETYEKEMPSMLVNSEQVTQNPSVSQAIYKARELAYRLKDEVGAPGLVIGVSIDGKTVWLEGLGLADVENRVPCHPDTVMRIASISKSMTMAVVAKLWQQGKLDLDKPVQHYVPSFPNKMFNKQEVTITTRQLVSHIAGIRHYRKPQENNNNKNNEKPRTSKEFYIKDRYETVEDSLKLFKDDDLMFKPGESFLYTTHGWTLVSAVVEAVCKQAFTKVMLDFFQLMGLKHTYLDESEPLIYNRARYYDKDKRGRLRNVPYVDNSYKWAGGGFLSTVGDLLHFGNAMLYSYQWQQGMKGAVGYLESSTVHTMWTALPGTTMKWGRGDGYGMGWVVVPPRQEHGGGDIQNFAVGHTGGAVGASSVLLVVPVPCTNAVIPSGVTVAIIMNLEGIGLQHLALSVAALFCEAQSKTSNLNISQAHGG